MDLGAHLKVTVYSRDNFSPSNAHSIYPWVIQNFIIAHWECVNNAGKLVEGGSGGDKRWTRMERGRQKEVSSTSQSTCLLFPCIGITKPLCRLAYSPGMHAGHC